MTRSSWKGKFVYSNLLSKKYQEKETINIWTRNSAIPANLIGKMVFVYNGKEFKKIYINRSKVGFKFGEFSLTKKFTKKQDKKKSKKKAK